MKKEMKRTALALLMAGVLSSSLVLPVMAEALEETTEAAETTETTEEEDYSLAGILSSIFSSEEVKDAVFGEGGLVNSLIGENGSLSEYIPEGLDVSSMVDSISEQIGDKDSDLYKTAGAIIDSVTTEDGELDMDAIAGYAELVGSLLGSGDEAAEATEAEDYGFDYKEAVEAYVAEANASVLKEGDTPLVASMFIGSSHKEDGTVAALEYIDEIVYQTEENKLSFVDQDVALYLFTLAPAEDGSWTVTDSKHTTSETDGDTFQSYLDEAEVTDEEFFNGIVFGDVISLTKLLEYSLEHEEIEAFEVNGEYLNQDELMELIGEKYAATFELLYPTAEEEGAEAEGAEVEEVEEVEEAAAAAEEVVEEVEEAAEEVTE